MSLYQLYRPQCFDDVLNQDVVIKTLKNSIKNHLVGHAYIFAGPKGIGKTTIAKIFSKAINCSNFKNDICNKCENCQTINSHNTTDILELDAASNNGVDDIRSILDTVKFLPNNLRYKVYIIDEAHMLSNSAWNALLKTLEEPNEYVVFIFATTEIHKIPTTIVSRCQCFEFHRLTNNQLKSLINKVCAEKNIKIDNAAINSLISLAEGSARDLLSLLEQAALFSNNNINAETIDELFGLINIQKKIDLINCLISRDLRNVLNFLDENEQKGVNFALLASDLANIFLDTIVYQKTQDLSLLKILNSDFVGQLDIEQEQAIKIIDICQNYFNQIKLADNPRYVFEIMLFNIMNQLNLNETSNEKPKLEQEKKIKINKKENKQDDDKKIDLNQFFTITDVHIHKIEKVSEPLEEKTIKNNSKIDIDKIMFQIANNRSHEAIDKAKKIFDEIKKMSDIQEFNVFINAKKVSLASKNGIILLFDEQLDADLLNQQILNGKIQRYVVKIASQPIYFIGVTENSLKILAKNIKTNQSEEYKKEPNLNLLRSAQKQTDPYSQLAFEQFGE